jgi:hypothetical protein
MPLSNRSRTISSRPPDPVPDAAKGDEALA